MFSLKYVFQDVFEFLYDGDLFTLVIIIKKSDPESISAVFIYKLASLLDITTKITSK